MAHSPSYPTAANGRIVGLTVKYGAPTVNLGSGEVICTSCSKTQAGEIKEYNDEAGDTVALVRKGDHREFSLECIIVGSVSAKKQGEQFTLTLKESDGTTRTYRPRVTAWNEQWSNEDASKVSVTARTYPKIDSGCDPEYSA